MKKIMTRGLLSALIALTCFIHPAASQAPAEKTLLWQISGNGLQKPSYLYGTIHMICESEFFISEKVRKAFNSSDKLMLEVNMTDPKEMAVIQRMMMADTPLSKKISPALFSELDSLMKLKTGQSLVALDKFKLFIVESLLALKAFDCMTNKSYEAEFSKLAAEKQKDSIKMEIGGLETAAEQMAILDGVFSDEYIINQLRSSKDLKASTKEMVRLYKSENLEQLYNGIMTEMSVDMNEDALNAILFKRNATWVSEIPVMIKKQRIFFAVGAAHLAGPQGVIHLLREKGYTLTPVMH